MDAQTVHLVVGDYPDTTAELITVVRGLVVGVGVAINFGSVYSTSLDLSIVEQGDEQPDQDILVVTGLTQDGWYYPVAQIGDTQGAAISGQYNIGVPVYGEVVIDLANAQPGDEVFITFRLA